MRRVWERGRNRQNWMGFAYLWGAEFTGPESGGPKKEQRLKKTGLENDGPGYVKIGK